MPRKKAIRIAAFAALPNTFEADPKRRKDWVVQHFHNTHSTVLELGCGKGEYALAIAEMFPEKNVVGVDRNAARLWRAASTALSCSLANVAFLQCNIAGIDEYFLPGSVSEIWLTFSDPFPRDRDAKHRLTAPEFLARYRRVLVPGGIMHIKTDDPDLWHFSRDTVLAGGGVVDVSIPDLYAVSAADPLLAVQTTFEKKHLAAGKKIFYLRWHW